MASIASSCGALLRKPPAVARQSAAASARAPRPASKASSPKQQDRETLLLLHLPQVRLIAEKIRARLRFSTELDDLIGYGVLGLMKAIERFDPSRGILLKTYAEHRIRGAILDGLRGMDWLPRKSRQKERESRGSLQRTQGSSRDPGANSGAGQRHSPFQPEEGSPTDSSHLMPPVPLVQILYAGWKLEDLEDMVERARLRQSGSRSDENPATLYERKETRRRLAQAISRLPSRTREVIHLYYYQELSMKQIGVILHVHESRVSQLHGLAIDRLRTSLAGSRQSNHAIARKTGKDGCQRALRKPSKYRVAVCKSSSVSMPMVSIAVSAT